MTRSTSPASPTAPAPAGAPGFVARHVGPRAGDLARMLDVVGAPSLDALIDEAVPATIRTSTPIRPPVARSEAEVAAHLRALADRNRVLTSMIGLGYHGTHTPAVIRRNVLENPAWYTAYTPYQPEISQGRLEAMLVFQTMVEDLTALPVAGASLLDEATSVVEAVLLMRRAVKGREGGVVVVDERLLPQSLAVLHGRAAALGLPVVVADLTGGLPHLGGAELVGVVVQQPGADGLLQDVAALVAAAHAAGGLVTVAADLLSLALVTPPGQVGADIAVGSSQRFGVPMSYGGPHAAYMAVRSGLERQLPGRLVGVSVDADGAPAYRLALQTREQHIRREKATSNICTAQALLAVVAAMYAVHHGPEGLRAVAERTHAQAVAIRSGLRLLGIPARHESFFDTVVAVVPGQADAVLAAAVERGLNLRRLDADHVALTTDETITDAHVMAALESLSAGTGRGDLPTTSHVAWSGYATTDAEAASPLDAGGEPPGRVQGSTSPHAGADPATRAIPTRLTRTSGYLAHPTFHAYRSETALMRYLRRLADKDLALDRTMIPLGSCTMKLNAAVELEAISWPGFANLHPYAPADQALGYERLTRELEVVLADLTGYAAVSLQPNAGSQGELAGLLAIRAYHRSRGDDGRDVCLIPASAHGTNAASAVLAGMRVVVVATAPDGEIDLADLHAKLAAHPERVAAIMITYPSTHGVFEAHVRDVAAAVHGAGGQVYIDGANLNALVGLVRPGEIGGDVSHLNLHKTFAIPHGGGGPGVGPVAVAGHLAPFLPADPTPTAGEANAENAHLTRERTSDGAVSRQNGGLDAARGGPASSRQRGVPADELRGGQPATPPVAGARYGSAGVLPISYAYVMLMGGDGLRHATETAILAANYLATRLAPHFPVLYTGPGGRVAHECVLDLRAVTRATGVTAEDVAKRLMDYGFHAPTLSFPVAGTLMVEPTESEDLAELDRFVAAMVAIRAEIADVEAGRWSAADSPLRGAPHTAASVVADGWDKPYSRETAAFPVAQLREGKYWPPVRRIDQAAGDRNLVCACPPLERYATKEDA